MRALVLIITIAPLAAACAGAKASAPTTNAALLGALNCGQEVRGFQIPHDAREDLSLAQDVRMGERRFEMRVWRVARPVQHVQDFYLGCMKMEPTSAGEEGSRHYEKGGSTLTLTGSRTETMIRLRYAP